MTTLKEDWPQCTYPKCTELVNPKRVLAMSQPKGKERCLKHGQAPKQYTVAPAFNKGPTMLISHGDIEDIGK